MPSDGEMFIQFLSYVATTTFFSTVIVGVIAWLAKTWISERLKSEIKHEYDQKLASHTAQLKAQNDVEIERLKSQLSIAAAERQVVFSRLQEKRANVIAETYSRLQKVLFTVSDLIKLFEPAGGLSRDDRRAAAAEAHKEFYHYYQSNMIFLPKGVVGRIANLNKSLVEIYNTFVIIVEPGGREATKTWVDLAQRGQKEIQAALSELEDDFRRLLGDTSIEPTQPQDVDTPSEQSS